MIRSSIADHVMGAVLVAIALLAFGLLLAGCVAVEVEDYGYEVVKDESGAPLRDANGVVQTVHKGQRWHMNKNMVEQQYDDVEFERQVNNVIKFRIANYKDAVSPELNKIIDTSFKGAAELRCGACREDRSRNRHFGWQRGGRGGSFPPEEGDCKLPLQRRQRGEGEDHLRKRQLHDFRRHDHRNLHGLLREVMSPSSPTSPKGTP